MDKLIKTLKFTLRAVFGFFAAVVAGVFAGLGAVADPDENVCGDDEIGNHPNSLNNRLDDSSWNTND